MVDSPGIPKHSKHANVTSGKKWEVGGEGQKYRPTLLEAMGGSSGVVYTMLPILAFTLGNASGGLPAAIGTAVATGIIITVLRIARKESIQPALSGLLGVAVASLIAWKMGSAKGFFLIGIWTSAVVAVLLILSIVIRRPLAGVIAGPLNGSGMTWVKDASSRRYYDIATVALVAVFAARFIVQRWLYDHDATGWLAVAKISMGFPLLALGFLVVAWASRSSHKSLRVGRSRENLVIDRSF
ncbi:DUF3159 domain-containing protein [Streptomyces sp. NPDC088788]|uniref:DUF3159 domain-containing protein n=1 Tax=Streptomyces sp. NPDC088788 TaxID=3365898 RepID=UPI00382A6276